MKVKLDWLFICALERGIYLNSEKKERVSYLYRTASTAYPCYLPVLGEFSRSWSYKTYPTAKLQQFYAVFQTSFKFSLC